MTSETRSRALSQRRKSPWHPYTISKLPFFFDLLTSGIFRKFRSYDVIWDIIGMTWSMSSRNRTSSSTIFLQYVNQWDAIRTSPASSSSRHILTRFPLLKRSGRRQLQGMMICRPTLRLRLRSLKSKVKPILIWSDFHLPQVTIFQYSIFDDEVF